MRPKSAKPHSANGKTRTGAEAKLGKIATAAVSARPATDMLHGLQVHHVELEIQNEPLRQSLIGLAESRDHYLDLYEFAPVAYLTPTKGGLIAEADLSWVESDPGSGASFRSTLPFVRPSFNWGNCHAMLMVKSRPYEYAYSLHARRRM